MMQLRSATQGYIVSAKRRDVNTIRLVDSIALRHYALLIQIQIAHCVSSMAPGVCYWASIASGCFVNRWQLAIDAI